MTTLAIQPGTKVTGAGRESFGYTGTVLAEEDPRAWANTMAFPVDSPDPAAVKAHVARCKELEQKARQQWPGSESRPRVAVAWCFGKTYWEFADSLKPVS